MAIDKKKELADTKKYPARRLNQRERKALETAMAVATEKSAEYTAVAGSVPVTIDQAMDMLIVAVADLVSRVEALEPE